MTRKEYIIEECTQVRAVATKLGVPHAEGLEQDELLRGIGNRNPEILAALGDHLRKYREWWEFALELERMNELGHLSPSASPKYALLVQERDSSRIKLSRALERAFNSD